MPGHGTLQHAPGAAFACLLFTKTGFLGASAGPDNDPFGVHFRGVHWYGYNHTGMASVCTALLLLLLCLNSVAGRALNINTVARLMVHGKTEYGHLPKHGLD